jgi:hypothetical protein
VIKFLTNSYVVVACREADRKKFIKGSLLNLHKKGVHAINSQLLLIFFTNEKIMKIDFTLIKCHDQREELATYALISQNN